MCESGEGSDFFPAFLFVLEGVSIAATEVSRWKFPVPYVPAASESGLYRYRKREKCNPFRPSCKLQTQFESIQPSVSEVHAEFQSTWLSHFFVKSFLYFPRVGGSVLPRHNLWKRKRGGTMFLPFFPLFATVISLLRFPPSLRTPSANPRGCGPSRGRPYRQVSGDRR